MIIRNTGNYVRFLGNIKLPPGTNTVPDENVGEIQQAIQHPINAYLIEDGELVLPEDFKFPSGITTVNVTKAGILIKDTHDLSVLDEFLEEEESSSEPRVTVIRAINSRIKEIKNPEKENLFKQQDDDDGTGGSVEEV
ncbi:hypothetical protein [Listeria booriae]|uniref:hypothetical protein n=1 Tax=Listeria booriae TaxID=1552123 RepID=UPI001623A70D|nr:hypothetical protein [Listeria booriae]MBC2148095.1 hypothetical protein [Listeria booriae]